jgi:hypothetical protein
MLEKATIAMMAAFGLIMSALSAPAADIQITSLPFNITAPGTYVLTGDRRVLLPSRAPPKSDLTKKDICIQYDIMHTTSKTATLDDFLTEIRHSGAGDPERDINTRQKYSWWEKIPKLHRRPRHAARRRVQFFDSQPRPSGPQTR